MKSQAQIDRELREAIRKSCEEGVRENARLREEAAEFQRQVQRARRARREYTA